MNFFQMFLHIVPIVTLIITNVAKESQNLSMDIVNVTFKIVLRNSGEMALFTLKLFS